MAALSIGCNLIDITKPLLDPILGAMYSVLHDLNGVKNSRGPSTCKGVSLRFLNFEIAFLGS